MRDVLERANLIRMDCTCILGVWHWEGWVSHCWDGQKSGEFTQALKAFTPGMHLFPHQPI